MSGRRLAGVAFGAWMLAAGAGTAHAQSDMSGMAMHGAHAAPVSRRGSGTAWLPDSTPLRELALSKGAWSIAFQGNTFAMYDQQYTQRGGAQLALTDWEMAMAMRPLGDGMLHLHLMTSLEPFILGGSGYAQLLQTGGTYRHAFLHDRMHPHDALMELSAQYERPIAERAKLSVYVAPIGEPAVGPSSFMHRPSAQHQPMAPIGHHWQDVSHQSYGVVTLGIGTDQLRLEGSLYNPREADENHPVADYRDAALDAYSGRLSWAPNGAVSISAWMAYLNTHERLDPTTRMHRWGASVAAQLRGPGGGDWATSLIWGVNVHDHGSGSHLLLHAAPGSSPHHRSDSVLLESDLAIGGGSALFARAEYVEKGGEALGFLGGDLTLSYPVQAYTLGAHRTLLSMGAFELSAGASATLNLVPQELLLNYGTRRPTAIALYTQFRPRRSH
jgi:hypothetical protein